MKNILFIIGGLMLQILAVAQSDGADGVLIVEEDTANWQQEVREDYIEDFSGFLTTRLFLSSQYLNAPMDASPIRVANLDTTKGGAIDYRPNTIGKLGVGFNYKWIGLNLGMSLGSSPQNDSLKGESKQFDFQMNMFGDKSGIDLYFQHYKGVYNNKPFSQDPSWKGGEPYPQREDIILRSAGAHYMYFFNNNKFSYVAPFLHTKRQKKSAGSAIAGGYGSYFHIKADSSIVPRTLSDDFGPAMDIRDGVFTKVGIELGYVHTLVFKRFYATLLLIPGLHVERSSVLVRRNKKNVNEWTTGGRMMARLAAGYNGEKWLFGMSAFGDTFTVRNKLVNPAVPGAESSLKYTVGSFRVFIVRRFALKKDINVDLMDLKDKVKDKVFKAEEKEKDKK